MFRLVKVLNGHTQAEVRFLKRNPLIVLLPGCALTCTNGAISVPATSDFPEYIALSPNNFSNTDKAEAILVTEDMVFKVEYTGSVTPMIGMTVGLAIRNNVVEAVTYSSSGKGTIIGLDEDTGLVYVRFRK